MEYTLFSYPDCASIVIRMVLEELNVPYHDQIVDMAVDEHLGVDFRRKNPRGMVPVLYDPEIDQSISETGAILSYLGERHGRLAPSIQDPGKRASFHQRLYFLSNTLHADAQIQYYTERYVGAKLTERVRPVIHERMRTHYTMIEAIMADHGGPWILGEEISVCDFYLGGCVRWSLIAPRHDPLDPEGISRHPHLNDMLTRLEARPSVIRAFAAEGTETSAFFRTPIRSIHTQSL